MSKEKGFNVDCNCWPTFPWSCLIGKLSPLIFGAKFLYQLKFIPDICNKNLMENIINITSPGQLHSTCIPSIKH